MRCRGFARLVGLLVLVSATAGSLMGCGGYAFKGRVIAGSYPSVEFVPAGDDRAQGSGLPGATIELIRDPDSLSAETVGRGSTDGQGNFSIPVDAFGAGWLEEDWLLRVRHPRATMVEQMIRLPGGSKLTIITLSPGRDSFTPREDLMKEMERFR